MSKAAAFRCQPLWAASLGRSPSHFVATWLFNHTFGSVLMTIILHGAEGSVRTQGWVYSGLWMILATGLVIFDWKSWRSPAPPAATTPLPDQPPKSSPRTAT